MRCCKNWPERKAGFTLPELLAVLVLTALAVSLAVPRMEGAVSRLRLRSDADLLARELRLAQQSAITEGQVFDVVFSAGGDCYSIRRGVSRRTVQLNPGVTVAGTSFPHDPLRPHVAELSACRFLPTGTPPAGGTICLRGGGGDRLFVAVTPVVGRVRVTETDPGQKR